MGKTPSKKVGITIHTDPEIKEEKKYEAPPLHILFAGDLSPKGRGASAAAEESAIISVDRSSFAGIMEQLSPSLTIDVADKLSETLTKLEISLQFPDLKAFRPEAIIAQVPALARFLDVRNLVQQVRQGSVKLSEFQKKARDLGVDPDLAEGFYNAMSRPRAAEQKPAPPPKPSQSPPPKGRDKLSDLLGMVDLGTGEQPAEPPVNPIEAILRPILEGDEPGSQGTPGDVDTSTAKMLENQIDQLLSEQVNAILHHPALQRLEASWRGLKFLVDRLNFRENIVLSVLPARKDEIAAVLRKKVLEPILRRSGDALSEMSVSAVIADYDFTSAADEVDILLELAEIMSGMQAVCITSAAPEFFGMKSFSELAHLPPVRQLFHQPEYVRWNSLRTSPISNALALVVPGFLLRYPYGANNPVKELSFTESAVPETGEGYLLGSGALVAGAALAARFAETGWPTRFSGSYAASRIENLPVWEGKINGGRARLPLPVLLQGDTQTDLSEAGFTVLSSRANDDGAYVAFAPTVHQPGRYEKAKADDESRLHATIAAQLMVSRIGQRLIQFDRRAAMGLTLSRLQAEIKKYLEGILGRAEGWADITVTAGEESSDPDYQSIIVQVTSPSNILGAPLEVRIEMQLRR
jgi:type VI secretion system protein ImpC